MLKPRSIKRARPDKGRAAGSPRGASGKMPGKMPGKTQAADTFRDFIRTLEKLDRSAARSRETPKEGGR